MTILIERVNQVIDGSPERLTIGQLFSLVAPAVRYNTFWWHMAKARRNGTVGGDCIAEGRGRKRYKGGGVRNKFAVGDRVRINRLVKRVPAWLREVVRIDAPRTVVAVFNVPRQPGEVPKTRHTVYR